MGNRYKTFGAQVQERREALGLSQSELASAAGLQLSMIRAIEKGATESPGRRTMGRLATALGSVVHIYSEDRSVVEALPQ
jgi:transcriptional regulator with XRE-family HTH domain